jgi:hypothetical protein
MWWEPRSTEEAELRDTVYRLHDRYRSYLEVTQTELVVRGVGVGAPRVIAATDMGSAQFLQYWRPLLLVSDRSLPVSPLTPYRFEFRDLDSDSLAFEFLRNWDLPGDALLEPVGPIIPAVQLGAAYLGVDRATVGLPVLANIPGPNHPGFLTVAHGVGPVGSSTTVDLQAGGIGIGSVQFRDDSGLWNRNGGDDIALVTLNPPSQLIGWLSNQGVQQPPTGPPYPTLPVDLYGGQSGRVIAQVTGALLQLGGESWQWLDCWELGVTQPLMQPGDSGSLAIDPSGRPSIFGHFVGGAPALRGVGFTHHWVQDLGRVLARQPGLTKEKAGCWTRRSAFAQVRRD